MGEWAAGGGASCGTGASTALRQTSGVGSRPADAHLSLGPDPSSQLPLSLTQFDSDLHYLPVSETSTSKTCRPPPCLTSCRNLNLNLFPSPRGSSVPAPSRPGPHAPGPVPAPGLSCLAPSLPSGRGVRAMAAWWWYAGAEGQRGRRVQPAPSEQRVRGALWAAVALAQGAACPAWPWGVAPGRCSGDRV